MRYGFVWVFYLGLNRFLYIHYVLQHIKGGWSNSKWLKKWFQEEVVYNFKALLISRKETWQKFGERKTYLNFSKLHFKLHNEITIVHSKKMKSYRTYIKITIYSFSSTDFLRNFRVLKLYQYDQIRYHCWHNLSKSNTLNVRCTYTKTLITTTDTTKFQLIVQNPFAVIEKGWRIVCKSRSRPMVSRTFVINIICLTREPTRSPFCVQLSHAKNSTTINTKQGNSNEKTCSKFHHETANNDRLQLVT